MKPLISIVMPAYNAAMYIAEAIRSVLAQEYGDWELLVVDDGSTDATREIIATFTDPRIRYFAQRNQGVSVARNTALDQAKGAFVCFLDADDALPPGSIRARHEVFERFAATDMVDGSVQMMDAKLERVTRTWSPTFTGQPLKELVHLTGSCFCGNTWLIRWSQDTVVRFLPGLTHGEDLLFYLGYARGRNYRYTDELVLRYRRSEGSSMSDLAGLHHSYARIAAWMRSHQELVDPTDRMIYSRRVRRIMAGSYWHAGEPLRALRAWCGL